MDFIRFFEEIFKYDPQSPMIFNSGIFLIMFIFFILIYAAIYKRKLSVAIFIVAFSCLFYYKSSGWYLLLLVLATFSDYTFALMITRSKTRAMKRFWLICTLVISLGLLAYFKYTNFILGNIYDIIDKNFQPLDIFLPIGISFFTFQSLSYVLDVYWEKVKPARNILDYAFFITYFPQLVAGPIVKASLFLPQLEKPVTIKRDDVYAGLWLIMVGLFKKAVIADYISRYNDLVFASPTTYSGFENLMAIYGYTLQIYCDFSGYSDMAIGIGKLMGFDLGMNFNFPYKARNITDFWRRWHISLSSWLREYLYIPLGGNRKGKVRTYINLFITMFLGGLWHGASWKFVFWGAWHGIGLAVHKATKPVLDRIPDKWPANTISWFITFHFVIFLWIFFRANNIEHEVYRQVQPIDSKTRVHSFIEYKDSKNTLHVQLLQNDSILKQTSQLLPETSNTLVIRKEISEGAETIKVNRVEDAFHVAWSMIVKVGTDMDLAYILPFIQVRYVWFILMIIGFAMHSAPSNLNEKILKGYVQSPYLVKLLVFIVLVQLVIQFKSEDVQPFIYFQF